MKIAEPHPVFCKDIEKYDAKPTYKKFLGYRPGVYVIGDMIVYVENSDGNTNVRFYHTFQWWQRKYGYLRKAL